MKHALVLLVATAALAVPASSFAQADGYNNVAGTTGGGNPSATAPAVAGAETQSATVSADSGGESLPFTGLEVGVILAVGAVLLVSGLMLRRTRTE